MGKQHDSHKTAADHTDHEAAKKEQTFIEGLGNALSNDENGFSNEEGFNKDGEHQSLVEEKDKTK